MWSAWRRRAKRDSAITPASDTLVGDLIEQFDRVFYVATTPPEQPLERLAIAGLTYRGYSSVSVLSDGVSIQVTGESAVTIPADHLEGASAAQLRIDKVVERDGLSVLSWRVQDRTLESSFRFADAQQHTAFERAVHSVIHTRTPDLTLDAPQLGQEK